MADTPIVHTVINLPVGQLHEDPENTQKQSRATFQLLRDSIREEGIDENLIVVPLEGKPGQYKIVSGNHRYRAGKMEGLKEFPCVIHEDWDENKARLQSVRRNYARGNIDKDAFTTLVDLLKADGEDVADIVHGMGFSDADTMALYYNNVMDSDEDEVENTLDNIIRDKEASTADRAQLIEDMGYLIQTILEEYGDTVEQSFIVFPVGGKRHMLIATTSTLRKTMSEVAGHAVATGMDLNLVLTGLLKIGLAQTGLLSQAVSEVKAADAEDPDGNEL